MQSLVAPGATVVVVPAEVGVRIDLLIVGEQLGVSLGSINPMSIVFNDVRARRDANNGPAAWLEETPGSGHGDQVAPWIELVTIPKKIGTIVSEGLLRDGRSLILFLITSTD